MSRILLISCNVADAPYPVYPLGMNLVAEAAKADGHEVAMADLLASGAAWREDISESLRRFGPDVVGLSLRNMDNVDSTGFQGYGGGFVSVARFIRGETDAPLVLGGSAFSLFPEALLKRLGADYGVVGEGEKIFRRLVRDLEEGRPPAGPILKNETPLAGEDFPLCARDGALADFYSRAGGVMNVQTKRGCPHRCAYCSYPALEGARHRFRPPEEAVEEMIRLRDEYGARYLAITDSVFNDRQGRHIEIAEEMIRRDLDLPWMAFFRPDRFRPADVELLKRSGLRAVEWGTDSACDVTLDAMGKELTWDQVAESARLFAEAEIPGAHFIIFGGPGETEATLREGLANIDRLAPSVVFAFRGVRLLPGVPLHRRAIREGLVSEDDDLFEPRFYYSPEISPERLDEAIRRSFAARPDRVYPPGKDQDKARALRAMGYVGPGWDLLLKPRRRRRR